METAVENVTPSTNDLLSAYLTREELAAVLKRDVRTIDRWNQKRVGPPRTMIGRMILYRKESVLTWLAEHEGKGASRRKAK